MRFRAFGLEVSLSRATPLSPVHQGGRGSWYPLVREPFTGAWQRNMEWRADTVMSMDTVYACTHRIAEDVGKLRVKLVEHVGNDVWREVKNASYSPVLRRPNHYQNSQQFREWWIISKLIHGNTYVLLERGLDRKVRGMHVLDPTKVSVLVAPDGEVLYELSHGGEIPTRVPSSEIIHDRGKPVFHPLVGTSPLFASGAAAHLAQQIQNNSTSFFAKGSNLSGILTTTVPITPDRAKQYKELWEAQYTGMASGGVAVLPDGMQFTAMRMTSVEAQVIEQLGWTQESVCRAYGVPAFMVGVGDMPPYQSVQMLAQIYYQNCLHSHIEAWENLVGDALGFSTPTEGTQYGVELDLDGLLRMDPAAQIEALVKSVGGAIHTPNEARARLNLEPKAGGDTPYLQQQNFSIAALDERDRNGPFEKPAAPPAPALPTEPAGETEEDRGLALELDLLTMGIAA